MIRFQENAIMEDKENEIVVKGGLIETWEDDEITIIQIGVRILKKDMVCRSEFARYLRKEDKLELSGMPRVIWKGDEYKALKILIDLENDEINLEGNVKGEVFWEDEDEEGKAGTDDESGVDDTGAVNKDDEGESGDDSAVIPEAGDGEGDE
jgi:lipopolysaccharide export system protein LptA